MPMVFFFQIDVQDHFGARFALPFIVTASADRPVILGSLQVLPKFIG